MSTISNLSKSPSLTTTPGSSKTDSTSGAVAGLSKSMNDLGAISGTNGNNAAAVSVSNPQFGNRENNGAAPASAIFKNFLG